MAIQVQGTTVIDDSRNIVGAKGISGSVGFNGAARTAVYILTENDLNINSAKRSTNVYYCKVTQNCNLSISDSDVQVPNAADTVEQLLLCIDYFAGNITFPLATLGTKPTFVSGNRYLISLTRFNLPSSSATYSGYWHINSSQAYSIA